MVHTAMLLCVYLVHDFSLSNGAAIELSAAGCCFNGSGNVTCASARLLPRRACTSIEHSVVITGEITGLQPGAHGLHVHAYGDLTNGCNSTKGHFNPMHKDHGAPEDRERHVGDLGNIKAEADGKARVYITDSMISLVGHHNIIGRAMVVHANPDDLGKGGTNESKASGSAGPRLACCVIGFVSGSGWTSPDLRLLFATFAFVVGVFFSHGV
ncbi:hypothetical protein HPB50_005676 [Hyalomma asiaticum]|uniref:Uncharacterized protein n=1 Tax=Hyalomma asiaticum TaxID=266040 RepID=A0ACB7S1H8_HYAAI|nr:hypothetical protein HPB50_005676 [Hyalomma asiaticum]